MKNFIFMFLLLCCFSTHAGEITIMETALHTGPYQTFIDASLQENGSVKVVVYEQRPGFAGGYYGPSGHYFPNQIPSFYTLLDESIFVEGLFIKNGKCNYQGQQCEITAQILGSNYDTKVIVTLKTQI